MKVSTPRGCLEFEQAEEACVHCWDDSSCRIPTSSDVVRKDECAYSFNTNAHNEGIFVSMKTFQGVSGAYLEKYFQLSGDPLYLLVHKQPIKIKPDNVQDALKVEVPEYNYALLCMECKFLHHDGVGITFESMTGIINAQPPKVADALTEDVWLQKVKYDKPIDVVVDPKFTPSHPPPEKPLCCDCGHEENNWMCLHCGYVGCPRKESGGKNHAINHFLMSGHALVVKLGTITPEGADAHNYATGDEVDVKKEYLHEALRKLGVDMNQSRKTAKSMAELQFDMMVNFDANHITEAGQILAPLRGPGRTGLHNFGNTCYMNSVIQCVFDIPQFRDRFQETNFIRESKRLDPENCFGCQMEKVAHGLFSGDFSRFLANSDEEDQHRRLDGCTPRDFKKLIAGNHREFSTGQQQDAGEYLCYFLTQVQRKYRSLGGCFAGSPSPTDAIEQTTETRSMCSACGVVKYSRSKQWTTMLKIPVEPYIPPLGNDGKPIQQTDEEIAANRPKTALANCLEKTLGEVTEIDCTCDSCGNLVTYSQTNGLRTFPDTIVLHLMREYFDKTECASKKLDVLVSVPDVLDLSKYRSPGPQAHENVVSDKDSSSSLEGAKEDSGPAVDEIALATLLSMGFDTAQATKALKACNNNTDRAIDWVFSHPPDEDAAAADPSPSAREEKAEFPVSDGKPEYDLTAMISHIGRSALSGHYVCHIKKDGQWIFFDDDKVVESKQPPKEFATVYFYRRRQE